MSTESLLFRRTIAARTSVYCILHAILVDSFRGCRVLNDEAYVRIRNLFLTGELRAGDRVTQETIAARLGVSRTPVHAALTRLEREMLLTSAPHRGFAVRSVTFESLLQLMTIRLRLEPMAAYGTARVAETRDIADLEALMALFEAAVTTGATERMRLADYRFHTGICQRCANPFLRQILTGTILVSFVGAIGLIEDPEITLEAHARIMRAMADHDARGAEAAMTAHLENGRYRLLSRIRHDPATEAGKGA